MKRTLHRVLIGAAALCLAGCLPEERFWWSPKGDRAVVSIDDKLHLVTADGELSPLPDELSMKDALVKTVSWLPDGSGFVCQRVRCVSTWAEARALIPAEEAAEVEQLMPAVLPLLEAATKLSGDAVSLDAVAKALPFTQEKRFGAALRRVFQSDPASVERLLKALPKGDEMVAALKGAEAGHDITELCVIKLTAPASAPVSLVRSLLKPSLMPRVSPKQSFVACLKIDETEESVELHVLPLDGGAGQMVARNVAGAFDWMPDGRRLVFMAPLGGEGEKLHGIHAVTVMEEKGALMRPGEPVTLATAITLNRPALQVLPDGRVLFASQPVTLPAAGTGTELEPRLYVVSADGKWVQPLPTAPGDLPTNLGFFAASPDGRHVAVVESETDAVAVVETDTGRTQLISPPHSKWQNRTLPAWKSATELAFAALHEGKPAWMLWSESSGLRCLSSSWPAESTAKWLHEDKERK
jgi:hypothetical protein